MMRPHADFGFWLLLPPLLLVAWILARWLGWLPKSRALPRSARLGNRVSHRAEALVLLCVAATIFVFTATNTSTGGRLLILDELQPGFAMTNVLVAVAAVVGVLVGVLVALFWRTSTGVIVAAGILCVYGTVVNGPAAILESLAPKDSVLPDASLTFALSSPDVEGAELYVNGVHLGTLPYETTYEKFHWNIPFWPDEPDESTRGNEGGALVVPDRWTLHGSQGSMYRPWARITVPMRPGQGSATHGRTYYARVKLGDEWSYAAGGSGSSGGGGGRYIRRAATVQFAFVFPDRQARIERLLDIARLNDYVPAPMWFEALDTYRSDGWIAVRKAMDEEPRMSDLLDRGAAWKYDLDKVTDSESAWNTFERIRAEADTKQSYLTSDLAGRAVELLVPKLDPEQLVRLARDIIRSNRLYSWSSWQMNGRVQFGNLHPGGSHTGADRTTGYSVGGRGDERLSPGEFAVAHAVWMLDEALDARDDTQPNIVEREWVAVFIAYNYRNTRLLRLATHIGGPAIETYLLRQDWRADPQDLPWRQQIRSGSEEVNGWLYLLAHLRSPVGQEFRRDNAQRLMRMADRLTERLFSSSWKTNIAFLFLDLDCGSESLAMRYWPRFKKKVAAQEKHDALSLQYQYLVRMEPLSTVDMYVQCWKEFQGRDMEFSLALDDLGKASIPYSKRRQIYTALADCIRRDVSNVVDNPPAWGEQRLCQNLLRQLEAELLPITDPARANDILTGLRAGNSRYKPENVAAWLAHGAATHPLVRMLAEAEEPSFRMLVMGALREHPTPDHRALLDKLLADENEQVRQKAQEVAAELETLRNMRLEALSSRLSGR